MYGKSFSFQPLGDPQSLQEMRTDKSGIQALPCGKHVTEACSEKGSR